MSDDFLEDRAIDWRAAILRLLEPKYGFGGLGKEQFYDMHLPAQVERLIAWFDKTGRSAQSKQIAAMRRLGLGDEQILRMLIDEPDRTQS